MRFKTFGPVLVVLASAAVATAQPTKVSGTIQCGKPEAQQAIPAADSSDHVFSIYKVNCNWTKPLEIAGTQTKDGTDTGFDEIKGNTAKGHGLHVSTAATGEKTFVRYQGSSTVKDGAPQTAEGMWSYTGGTGKLAGIKGKGTYKGKANPDGSITYEIEGEYELPKK